MKSIALVAIPALALLAQPPCAKQEPPSAKQELEGKIVFSEGTFEDAKKYKTEAEFEKAEHTVTTINPAAPQAHLAYYSAFKEPLNATNYMVQVFDTTDPGTGAPVHVETRDGKPETTQVTAGWGFDIPQWPPPADPTQLMSNDVWIKPGHSYQVVILKPLAQGNFSVGGSMQAAATPTPAPEPAKPAKKKKGK